MSTSCSHSYSPAKLLELSQTDLSCRGLLANAILLVFYASPLSTVAEVVSTRSSASLYAPLCAMNVVNGLLWVTYGYVRPSCVQPDLSKCCYSQRHRQLSGGIRVSAAQELCSAAVLAMFS